MLRATGYYYTDPSGRASWWVGPGETPATAAANPSNPANQITIDRPLQTSFVPAGTMLPSRQSAAPPVLVPSTISTAPLAQPGRLPIVNRYDDLVLRLGSGATKRASTLQALDAAFRQGYKVVRPDGTDAIVQNYLGGWLIDGHPLNVLLGQGWLPGQREALAPAVAEGAIPAPYLLLDVTAPTATGAPAAPGSLMDLVTSPAGLAVGAVLAYLAFRRKTL